MSRLHRVILLLLEFIDTFFFRVAIKCVSVIVSWFFFIASAYSFDLFMRKLLIHRQIYLQMEA